MPTPTTLQLLKHPTVLLVLFIAIGHSVEIRHYSRSSATNNRSSSLNDRLRSTSRMGVSCASSSDCTYKSIVCCPPCYWSFTLACMVNWLKLFVWITGLASGCTCSNADICWNSEIYLNNAKSCPTCDGHLDCPTNDTCITYNVGGMKGSLCSSCGKAVDENAMTACIRPCASSETGEQCKQISCSEGFYGSAFGTDYNQDRVQCACRCCYGVRSNPTQQIYIFFLTYRYYSFLEKWAEGTIMCRRTLCFRRGRRKSLWMQVYWKRRKWGAKQQ